MFDVERGRFLNLGVAVDNKIVCFKLLFCVANVNNCKNKKCKQFFLIQSESITIHENLSDNLVYVKIILSKIIYFHIDYFTEREVSSVENKIFPQ